MLLVRMQLGNLLTTTGRENEGLVNTIKPIFPQGQIMPVHLHYCRWRASTLSTHFTTTQVIKYIDLDRFI